MPGTTSGFGAKVKLTVDPKGAAQFKREIQDAVNQSKSKINIGEHLTVSKSALNSITKQIRDHIKAQDFTIQSIPVKKIEIKDAIKNVQAELQKMLSNLSVKNGVNIGGLVDYAGADQTQNAIKNAADAAVQKMNETKRAVAETSAEMTVLNQVAQKLASTYKSGLSGSNAIADTAKLNEITREYQNWLSEIEKVKAAQNQASAEEIRGLQQRGIAIQREIDGIREAKKAAKEKARDEKKAADEAAKATKRKAAADKKAAAEAKRAGKAQQDNLRRVAQLQQQITRYRKSNTKLIGTEDEVELLKLLERLKNAASLTSEEIDDIALSFKNVQKSALASGNTGKSFLDMLASAYQRFGGWSIVTNSLGDLVRGFRQVVNNVIELDTAMTELRKVTDETDATYAQFFDDAITRSEQMGATLVDTISATSDFARLGYDIVDSAALADAAVVYKNVGDGIEDIAMASESLISTMAAFKLEASDAMHIVDSFNEVDNKFAISSAGIGEALIRSASGLAAAGNTMEEAIALITAMNTTVQNPEKVGEHIAQCRSNAA